MVQAGGGRLRSKRHRPPSTLGLGGVTWGRGDRGAGVRLLQAPRHSRFWDREELAAEAFRAGVHFSMVQFILNNPHWMSQHRDGHYLPELLWGKAPGHGHESESKDTDGKIETYWDKIFKIGGVPRKIYTIWFPSTETNRMLNCWLFVHLFWPLSKREVGVHSYRCEYYEVNHSNGAVW